MSVWTPLSTNICEFWSEAISIKGPLGPMHAVLYNNMLDKTSQPYWLCPLKIKQCLLVV